MHNPAPHVTPCGTPSGPPADGWGGLAQPAPAPKPFPEPAPPAVRLEASLFQGGLARGWGAREERLLPTRGSPGPPRAGLGGARLGPAVPELLALCRGCHVSLERVTFAPWGQTGEDLSPLITMKCLPRDFWARSQPQLEARSGPWTLRHVPEVTSEWLLGFGASAPASGWGPGLSP